MTEITTLDNKLAIAQRLYGQEPRPEIYLWNQKTMKTFPNGAKDRGPSWALQVALTRWREKVERLQRAMPLTAVAAGRTSQRLINFFNGQAFYGIRPENVMVVQVDPGQHDLDPSDDRIGLALFDYMVPNIDVNPMELIPSFTWNVPGLLMTPMPILATVQIRSIQLGVAVLQPLVVLPPKIALENQRLLRALAEAEDTEESMRDDLMIGIGQGVVAGMIEGEVEEEPPDFMSPFGPRASGEPGENRPDNPERTEATAETDILP